MKIIGLDLVFLSTVWPIDPLLAEIADSYGIKACKPCSWHNFLVRINLILLLGQVAAAYIFRVLVVFSEGRFGITPQNLDLALTF